MKLRFQILIGFCIVIILFTLVTIINIQLSKEINKNIEQLTLLEDEMKNLAIAEKLVIDLETGLRGFLLSDKEDFLEPYYEAKKEYLKTLHNSSKSEVSFPIRKKIKYIESKISHWIGYFAEPLINAKRNSIKDSNTKEIFNDLFIKTAKKGVGKQITDSIRDIFDEFNIYYSTLKTSKSLKIKQSTQITDYITIILNAVAALIALLITIIITARVSKRINKMVTHAENISMGNYNVSIKEKRNDELSKLSVSLNIMSITIKENFDKLNRLNKELIVAKNETERLYKVKEKFLASITHEIRTPLNSIIGFTDLLLKQETRKEQAEFLNIIKTSGKNLISIVNDMLDFSKMEYGSIKLNEQEFNLSNVIYNVFSLLKPLSDEKNLNFTYSLESNVPINLFGDESRLSQILLNLLNNSIKFTHEGDVKLIVKLHSVKNEKSNLLFVVSDTGIGIEKEKCDIIFDSFTQVHDENSRKYGGTGLGLSIVKKLIELQNGKISVESIPGKGSKFIAIIPYKTSNNKVIEHKQLTDIKNIPVKILVVDDNQFNLLLVEKMLANWNSSIDSSNNGHTAILKSKETNYDIILMDLQMPDIDGFETVVKIRETNPYNKTVPIIALTAHAIGDEKDKYKSSGMDDYLVKPFDEDVLYEKITSLLKKNEIKSNIKEIAKGKSTYKQIINLKYLYELGKNDNEFIFKILTEFKEQLNIELINIQKALNENNNKIISGILHKIKPSFIIVGAESVNLIINELEKELKTSISLDSETSLKISNFCQIGETIINEVNSEIENLQLITLKQNNYENKKT